MRTKFSLVAAIAITLANDSFAEPVIPEEEIDLLDGASVEDFVTVLNPKLSTSIASETAFDFREDGSLRVSGEGWGYLRTKESYRNYHMVVEFKWGEHTHGARADKARDCGVFVHINGADRAVARSWPRAVEVQLLEGSSGNLSLLGHRGASWEVLSATPGKDSVALAGERLKIENAAYPEGWTDVRGAISRDGIERPLGYWNRLEVVASGEELTVLLNGKPVNGVKNLVPAGGAIGIQSELAECWIRRWQLYPLGKFTEPWENEIASTDTGYSPDGESLLPREFPLSPEDSLAAWEIDGDYELQLVANEPLVCDPVDVVWDAAGRMYVAEMGDYPLPAEAGPMLSRIRLLKDVDGDGQMDEAVTWADHLDHVQGLTPLRDGLLATTRTAILFLRDTNGDDVADEITTLFESNEPRHNQLQISSPRWGLDAAIYLNNGLDGKEIYPAENPEAKLNITRMNLRLDLASGALTPVTGVGQYGATQDDWGRRFYCSNRNPGIMTVMELDAMRRNPFANITQGHEDVAIAGEASKVYPLQLSHTTANAHAGTHTAACGHAIYRGDLVPSLKGDLFVCEPTGQLIVRNRLSPNGGSLSAQRVGEGRDFLASRDEWSRPVNIRNGPDGALYICDMYRRFIDHAQFFPEEFSKSHYMRAGVDQGRIYRLVKKGAAAPKVDPLPVEDPVALVATLASPNAWQRIHAQRVLLESGRASEVADELKLLLANAPSPLARVHALHTLNAIGELSEELIKNTLTQNDSAVLENIIPFTDPVSHADRLIELVSAGRDRVPFLAAIQLAGNPSSPVTDAFHSALTKSQDPWLRRAVLSSSKDGDRMARLLAQFIADGAACGDDTISDFTKAVAAKGTPAELQLVLAAVGAADTSGSWSFAFATGLSEGLRRSPLKTKTLQAFVASPPAEVTSTASLKKIIESAGRILVDSNAAADSRIRAIPLVKQQGMEPFLKIVDQLLVATGSPEVQGAVCQALSSFDRNAVADFFFERWAQLGPTPKREALALIAGNSNTAFELMKKMKAGEISPALMDPMARWRYARSTNEEVKALAIELFGQASGDRAKVVADYRTELTAAPGDPVKGREVFQRAACFTCHKVGDLGMEVGPSLADVKIKPAAGLLSDILDPNRAVEERWAAYTVTTNEGQVHSGLVAAETAQSVELRMPGGVTNSIPRNTIQKMETTGSSLMPEGLEGAISKTEMRDLIAFLKQGSK